MALDVKDGNNVSKTLKTTLDGADHVAHHIIDNLPADTATSTKQDTGNSSLVDILNKIIATPSTEAKQDDLNALIASIVKDEDSAHVSGDKGIMLLGIRSDSDASTANNGDYTVLKLDEEGRLKISSKPASYADVTGSITAIQATVGTPVAGGTVIADVSRASNVMMYCTGTFSTINVTFEGCLELTGENWFTVQAVRSNANTIETTSGNLSAAPAYAWELSVNALARVRVRCTARTSGTQNWLFKLGTYATEPIPAAQVTATQPISGTVTASNAAGTAAHSAASSGNPVRVAGRVKTANDTTLVSGDVSDMAMTTDGALISKPYSVPEVDWVYAAAGNGIVNTTTAVTIKTAAGAGLRNYMTGIQLLSETLGAATEVAVRDGAGGTVIWRTKLSTAAQPLTTIIFPNPLKGTANTLLEVVTLSASVTGAVYFNAQGYIAP